jgi:hypothetical protein
MLASDIYKANVYDLSENKIGDVADLIIDSNGNVTAAIVSVGGFIGVGQKEVMIPFQELNPRRQGLAHSQSHQRRPKNCKPVDAALASAGGGARFIPPADWNPAPRGMVLLSPL